MYDAFDRRVEKHLPGDLVVYYWYGLDGSLLAETDAEGSTVTENIYLDGSPLAVLGPDRDGDWILDRYDNCVAHKNLDQRDTNGDGFGNRCDPDLNNNGIVNLQDRNMMEAVFYCSDSSQACQDADLDGSGAVNFTDLGILLSMHGQPPGPKGGDNPNGVSGTLYVHTDHLGTPRMITDDTGTAVWSAWYEPFGKATVTDNGIDPVVFNLRFPGQYYDSETGLHYNYFRYYDPQTGRYLQSDPIGLAGGLNTYAYVAGNPISNVDPWGLACSAAGCWPTPEERAQAEAGNFDAYYALACTGDDSYACQARGIAANEGWRANYSNWRLRNSLTENGKSEEQCDTSMEDIRKQLAFAHLKALDGATPELPRVLTADQIAAFHEEVFRNNGAGDVFGGDTFGEGVIGRWIINTASPWCTSPSCRL